MQDRSGQVGELQVNVVFLGTYATAFTDLDCHGAGDDVARGEVLGGGGVALHETLALGVEEDTTFAAGAWREKGLETLLSMER
ncbi:hypothetical protein BC936DRAFT_149730 [Jimgerdemannia flammicorona]|uniref:Uncharacterized protein n=2 Tax=Jimgerdemannia flammicorona TaxID=994334 RepID=A0A433D082_9FUNG|nr:hypothetical protein BC936DRAFT_149730 [Jimgerdemannia flammicorona]RUS27243.1 hypothetical protein BC938DRAFT_483533 [Jimgerdemannia flammicorona]